jgi:hypothetical protein
MNKEKISTTVKIETYHYKEFKVLGIRNNITLQDFVDKCLRLYVSESSFRETINNIVWPAQPQSSSFQQI